MAALKLTSRSVDYLLPPGDRAQRLAAYMECACGASVDHTLLRVDVHTLCFPTAPMCLIRYGSVMFASGVLAMIEAWWPGVVAIAGVCNALLVWPLTGGDWPPSFGSMVWLIIQPLGILLRILLLLLLREPRDGKLEALLVWVCVYVFPFAHQIAKWRANEQRRDVFLVRGTVCQRQLFELVTRRPTEPEQRRGMIELPGEVA